MRIGIVACGDADGSPRHAPGGKEGQGTPVRVDGLRRSTVGRVSMDMLAVDPTQVPGAAIGSEVTLWGHGPAGSLLPIDEVARAAGTTSYELMCALAAHVPAQVAPTSACCPGGRSGSC
jgi:alanine racemase